VEHVVRHTASPHTHAAALTPDAATAGAVRRVNSVGLHRAAGDLDFAIREIEPSAGGGRSINRVPCDHRFLDADRRSAAEHARAKWLSNLITNPISRHHALLKRH